MTPLSHSSINWCYQKTFRTTVDRPGFAVLDLGPDGSSAALRQTMVDLKHALTQQVETDFGQTLNYQWLGRFDQQVSTKYHLDNAADQSFLMLGYEPTEVESELYFADYVRFSQDRGIDPADYFDRFNPVFSDHEGELKPYITQVNPFARKHYKIALINNSNSRDPHGTLGVLHMARIVQPLPGESRVVNSMMLGMGPTGNRLEETNRQELNFLTIEFVSW